MAAISAEQRRDIQYSRRRNRLSSRYVYSRWMAGNFTRRFLEGYAPLILKRAPIGDNQDDYDVLENGVVVGRIFTVPTAPPDRSWMWASHGSLRDRRSDWEMVRGVLSAPSPVFELRK